MKNHSSPSTYTPHLILVPPNIPSSTSNPTTPNQPSAPSRTYFLEPTSPPTHSTSSKLPLDTILHAPYIQNISSTLPKLHPMVIRIQTGSFKLKVVMNFVALVELNSYRATLKILE